MSLCIANTWFLLLNLEKDSEGWLESTAEYGPEFCVEAFVTLN